MKRVLLMLASVFWSQSLGDREIVILTSELKAAIEELGNQPNPVTAQIPASLLLQEGNILTLQDFRQLHRIGPLTKIIKPSSSSYRGSLGIYNLTVSGVKANEDGAIKTGTYHFDDLGINFRALFVNETKCTFKINDFVLRLDDTKNVTLTINDGSEVDVTAIFKEQMGDILNRHFSIISVQRRMSEIVGLCNPESVASKIFKPVFE